MRYLRQFSIILLFSLAGEALHALLPLPVPASIYGIVLLLACLMAGVVRVDAIREVSSFLIEIMPVMFIPAAVGLMNDTDNRVQLLIDRCVAECPVFACHPCVNTSSLRMATRDMLGVFLPAVRHEPILVDLPADP